MDQSKPLFDLSFSVLQAFHPRVPRPRHLPRHRPRPARQQPRLRVQRAGQLGQEGLGRPQEVGDRHRRPPGHGPHHGARQGGVEAAPGHVRREQDAREDQEEEMNICQAQGSNKFANLFLNCSNLLVKCFLTGEHYVSMTPWTLCGAQLSMFPGVFTTF